MTAEARPLCGEQQNEASLPRETGRSFRHHFEGPYYRRLFLAGVQHIPQELQRVTMPMWAGIFHALVPSARRAAERNLERVCGPLSPRKARRRSFRLFVHYAQAITNMYALHLGQRVPVVAETLGAEILTGLKQAGRGAVLVTGHMGYWQIAPFLMEKKPWYAPMTMAMAEEPNARLAEFEQRFRQRMRIVYTTGSPFATLSLAQVIARGELVGMQLDRHLGGAHVMLPFFGQPAPFPLGPATLARATRAPIVPIFVLASPDRRRCTFHVEPPIEVRHTRDRDADVRDAMARTVEVYQRYVRRFPEQWFNFHDFWQAPGPTEAAPRVAA
jgi:KDO2-lipid IV(A) lauroyltransferase